MMKALKGVIFVLFSVIFNTKVMEWRDRDTEKKKAKRCGRYEFFFDLPCFCLKQAPFFHL